MRLVKEKCNKMFEDIFDKQSGMKLFKYRRWIGREREREKTEGKKKAERCTIATKNC